MSRFIFFIALFLGSYVCRAQDNYIDCKIILSKENRTLSVKIKDFNELSLNSSFIIIHNNKEFIFNINDLHKLIINNETYVVKKLPSSEYKLLKQLEIGKINLYSLSCSIDYVQEEDATITEDISDKYFIEIKDTLLELSKQSYLFVLSSQIPNFTFPENFSYREIPKYINQHNNNTK